MTHLSPVPNPPEPVPGDATATHLARLDWERRQQRLRIVPSRHTAGDLDLPPVLAWCDGMLAGSGVNLLLTGPVGTGKTWAAWAAYRHLVGRGWAGSFAGYPAAELVDLLRPDGDRDALRRCCEVSLLLLDDLGAERPSEWVSERLGLVVDGRYQWRRPTVVTTNVPRSKLAVRLGDRVASRLLEGAVVVALTGPDRRRG